MAGQVPQTASTLCSPTRSSAHRSQLALPIPVCPITVHTCLTAQQVLCSIVLAFPYDVPSFLAKHALPFFERFFAMDPPDTSTTHALLDGLNEMLRFNSIGAIGPFQR